MAYFGDINNKLIISSGESFRFNGTDFESFIPLDSASLNGYATETYVNDALTSFDLSGYASLSGSYSDPSWITSLNWSKISGITGTPDGTKFLRDDGTWQTISVGSSGISSLNNLTDNSQTFSTGSAGIDFSISSNSGVHTFDIPSASATARGLVTTGTQTFAGAKTFSSDVAATGFKSGNGGLFFPSGYTVLRDFAGNNVLGIHVTANTPVCSTNGYGIGANYYTPDVVLTRDQANILALRNSTNAQTFRLYNTYTSSTNNEFLQLKAVVSNNFEIGPQSGSGGGTLRGLTIGGYSGGSSTITPWLSFDNTGIITAFASSLNGPSTWTIASDVASGDATLNLTAGKAGNSSGTQTIRLYVNAVPALSANNFGTTLNGTGNNGLVLTTGQVTRLSIAANTGNISIINSATSSGSQTGFSFTGAAHTGQTASTEATMVNFNLAQTVQFSTGALTTQRAFRIQAPTYSFAGASTITAASTLSISGPPIAGTNATITSSYALNIESGASAFAGPITIGSLSSGYSSQIHKGINSYGIALGHSNTSTPGTTFNFEFGNCRFQLCGANGAIDFGSTVGSPDLTILREGANILGLRNSTNSQEFRIYNTFTSTTNYERFKIKAKPGANFEIGPENGSAGGTLRGLTIGEYSAGSSTITPWLSFDPDGSTYFYKNINMNDRHVSNVYSLSNTAQMLINSPEIAFEFSNIWFWNNRIEARSTISEPFSLYLIGKTYDENDDEFISIKATQTGNFEFGVGHNSAGSSVLRGLVIGNYSSGISGSITPWLSFNTSGDAIFSGDISASNLSGNNTGDQDLSDYAMRSELADYATFGYVDTTFIPSYQLNSLVPYTGASSALNLGSQNLSAGSIIASGPILSTNAYTSSTNFEQLRIRSNSTQYEISSIVGSAGGSNRPIQIGHTDATDTFTAALSINTNGTFTVGNYTLPFDDGDENQVLATDGSGNVNWTTVSGVGGVNTWEDLAGTISTGWNTANSTSIKTIDVETITLTQLANIVSTLIDTLKNYGLVQ